MLICGEGGDEPNTMDMLCETVESVSETLS